MYNPRYLLLGWFLLVSQVSSLIGLLSCVVFLQMYVLLFEWERLTPEKAMELLDYHYADVAVRNYAVDCLEQLEYVIKLTIL